MRAQIQRFLGADEPWIREGTLTGLLGRPADDPEVVEAHRAFLAHPAVRGWVEASRAFPQTVLKRHNQASLPHHLIALLADLGLRVRDEDGAQLAEMVLSRQGDDGALLSQVELPKAFGGNGAPEWVWMGCDAPLLLDTLVVMGLGADPRVQRAIDQLVSCFDGAKLVCRTSIPGVRGPGRKDDPCPYANLLAVRVLSRLDDHRDGQACRAAAEMLLSHWENRAGPKLRFFGIGTTFGRLKYPLIWYDLLHVLDALSRVPAVHGDPRFLEMLARLEEQALDDGTYKPGSVWMNFRGLDFAQKRGASLTLTWAVERVLHGIGRGPEV